MSASPFHVEIDRVNGDNWTRVISQFDDAVIYQTLPFGAAWTGSGNLSHLVLRKGDEIVGFCQVALRRLPVIKIGVAYVVWGPLWKTKQGRPDPDVFAQLIQTLKAEYALKRGYLLRLWPAATGEEKQFVRTVLEREGFRHVPKAPTHRTLRLDLTPSLEDLRKNLVPRWRTSLNKAEKNGLSLVEGTDAGLFGTFMRLARECEEKKNFHSEMDYEVLRVAQMGLPDPMKMRFMFCLHQGEPVCVSAFSAIGETGIYILGATGEKGYGLNASYLLQWRMIERLKETGVRYYDLGGIDPDNNPGVYRFKAGVVGKSGQDERFLGEYHGSFTGTASLAKCIIAGSKFLRGAKLWRSFSRSWQRRQKKP
jgi:hypothetical protein